MNDKRKPVKASPDGNKFCNKLIPIAIHIFPTFVWFRDIFMQAHKMTVTGTKVEEKR